MPFDFRIVIEELFGMGNVGFEIRKQDIINLMNEQLNQPNDEGNFHTINNIIINKYIGIIASTETSEELEKVMKSFLYESRVNFLAYFKYLTGKNDALLPPKLRLAYNTSFIIAKFNIKSATKIEEIEVFAKNFFSYVEDINKNISSGNFSWDTYAILTFQRMIIDLESFRGSSSNLDNLLVRIGENLENFFASKDVLVMSEIVEILDLIDAIAETIIKQQDEKAIDSKLSRVRFKNISRDKKLIESCNI